MQADISQVKPYTRGPYKNRLYRTKNASTTPMSVNKTKILIEMLEEFKAKVKNTFTISDNRSKTLENIQGLLDCFRKQINKPEDPMAIILEKLGSIEERLSNLEGQSDDFSELDSLLIPEDIDGFNKQASS